MNKQNYTSRNATKSTTKKTLNKIMPIVKNGKKFLMGGDPDQPNGSVPQLNSIFNTETNENLTNGSIPPPIQNPYASIDYTKKPNISPSMTDNGFNNKNAHSDMNFQPMEIDPKKKGFWQEDPNDSSTTRIAREDSQGYSRQHPGTLSLGFNTGDNMAIGAAIVAGLLPDQIAHSNAPTQMRPYNPRPYGDGTQAIAKNGKTFDNGGSITTQERDAWERMQSAAYQQGYLGDNHNAQASNSFMKSFGIDPSRLGAFQQDFQDKQGTDSVRSGAEGYSPVDNFYGNKTAQQRYVNYQTEEQDSKGNVKPGTFQDYGTNQAGAIATVQGWKNPVQAQDITSLQPVSKMDTRTYNDGVMSDYDKIHMDGKEAASGIHIKPSHKGRFTAYKKRTGETTEQALYSKNPHVRQMANFARNAKKWKHEDGGDFEDMDEAANGIQMLGAGSVQPMGANAYSDPMMWSEGPSHEDGGMPMRVGDQSAEIQGGEGVQQHNDGSTVVYGGMKIPKTGSESKGLAGRTFQSIAKEIGQQEEKNMKRLATPSQEIQENADPSNRMDSLKLGSAMAMASAFKMRSASLTAQKDHLKNIQEMMQEDADKEGVDYKNAHSLYGKNGFSIKAGGGYTYDIHGGRSFDMEKARKLGYKGPADTKQYQDFLDKTYPDQVQAQGVGTKSKQWKDGIWGKRTDAITDAALGVQPAGELMMTKNISRIPQGGLSTIPVSPQQQDIQPMSNVPTIPSIGSRRQNTSMTDENQLGFTDFLPEMNYLLKQPQQVLGQQYKPYLETPYQVSFQDRRNQNQSSFNEVARQLQGQGTAVSLAALAGQKYEADNQINAEEFRTNQGIYNGITNQNYNTLNDASKTNLAYNDQQYVRQAQAKSNTDAQRAQALASISSKIAQNRFENNNIELVEQRSGFRPIRDPQTGRMIMQYQDPDASSGPYGSGQSTAPTGKITQKFDSASGEWINDTRTIGKEGLSLKAKAKAIARWGNAFNS